MKVTEAIRERVTRLTENFRERLSDSEAAQEEPPIEAIQRLLAAADHIAQAIHVFDKDILDLLTKEERSFFVKRFSLALFKEFSPKCPWKDPFLPEEKMAVASYQDVLSYVEENFEIKTTFTEDDFPYGCCIKRAIDYAATKTAQIFTDDLKQQDRFTLATFGFQQYYFKISSEVPLLMKPEASYLLYERSAATRTLKLRQELAEERDKIIEFRNLQQSGNEPILAPSTS